MTVDHIRLELPAAPAYGRVARTAAANLAERRRFLVQEIDELRLAMDEAAILLLRADTGQGRLVVTFEVREHELTVDLQLLGRPTALTNEGVERFGALAGALIDHYEIDVADLRLRLTKESQRV